MYMKTLTITFATLLTLVVIFFMFNSYIYHQKQAPVEIPEPYQATLTGTQVCLPPKNTDGPVTMECAIGIKTDSDEYYALDFNPMSQTPPIIANGQRFTASGVITPIEYLSSDHWQKYIVTGIFSVTNGVEIEGVTPAEPDPITPLPPVVTPPIVTPPAIAPSTTTTVTAACYVGGCSSQICSDQPDMVSDCMYREEYACYKQATCERQSTGQCGWTETPALTACVTSSAQNTEPIY